MAVKIGMQGVLNYVSFLLPQFRACAFTCPTAMEIYGTKEYAVSLFWNTNVAAMTSYAPFVEISIMKEKIKKIYV